MAAAQHATHTSRRDQGTLSGHVSLQAFVACQVTAVAAATVWWWSVTVLLCDAGGYSTGYEHDPEEKAKYTDADNANFNP